MVVDSLGGLDVDLERPIFEEIRNGTVSQQTSLVSGNRFQTQRQSSRRVTLDHFQQL